MVQYFPPFKVKRWWSIYVHCFLLVLLLQTEVVGSYWYSFKFSVLIKQRRLRRIFLHYITRCWKTWNILQSNEPFICFFIREYAFPVLIKRSGEVGRKILVLASFFGKPYGLFRLRYFSAPSVAIGADFYRVGYRSSFMNFIPGLKLSTIIKIDFFAV